MLIFVLVLHPGLKLEYFRQKEWEEEWIDNAEALVHEKYTADYKDNKDPMTPTPAVNTEPVSTIIGVSILILITLLQLDDNDFADISVTNNTGPKSTELEDYLRKPVEKVKEPLKWWVANRHVYPTLHRMALDYLSIPGSSVHLFSLL